MWIPGKTAAMEQVTRQGQPCGVYRQMLAQPDWGVAELGEFLELPEQELRDALDQLFVLALVRRSLDQPGTLHAVGPDAGLHRRA